MQIHKLFPIVWLTETWTMIRYCLCNMHWISTVWYALRTSYVAPKTLKGDGGVEGANISFGCYLRLRIVNIAYANETKCICSWCNCASMCATTFDPIIVKHIGNGNASSTPDKVIFQPIYWYANASLYGCACNR